MGDVGERWDLNAAWTGNIDADGDGEGQGLGYGYGFGMGTGSRSWSCGWGQASSSNSRMLPCQTAPVTTPSAAAALGAIPLKNSTSCSGTEGNGYLEKGGYHQKKLVITQALNFQKS